MQLWHLTLSARTRHALFPSEALRLLAVHKLIQACGDALVVFCVADDHLHWVVLCDVRRRADIARAVKLVVAGLSPVETKPVHFEPVHGRNHMMTLLRYVLRQPEHHGLPGHSALWVGSCFSDLVGARWVPGLRLRLFDVLPRCTVADVFEALGLDRHQLRPVPVGELRAVGVQALVGAAAAACGAPSELRGKRTAVVRARRAACSLAREAGIPTREVSWALGVHPGNARKLLTSPVSPEALLATRVWLALERVVVSASARSRIGGDNAHGSAHRWERR